MAVLSYRYNSDYPDENRPRPRQRGQSRRRTRRLIRRAAKRPDQRLWTREAADEDEV
nr:hypothetical protein KPHV_85620 [Kitasatospora purpeofusca]